MVLFNECPNVTGQRPLGAPGSPRCHCIPKSERNIGILVVTTRAHKFNPRVYSLVTTHMHCTLSSTYRVVIFIHPVIELDHCYKPSSEHYSCRLYVVLHHKFPPTCRAVPQISQRASTHFAPPSVLHTSPDTSSRSTVSKVLCSVR